MILFSFLGRLQGIFSPNLPNPPPLKSQMVCPLDPIGLSPFGRLMRLTQCNFTDADACTRPTLRIACSRRSDSGVRVKEREKNEGPPVSPRFFPLFRLRLIFRSRSTI